MRIELPNELVEELVERNLIKKPASTRGMNWQLVLEGISAASSLVTLLGTPAVIQFYSEWIKSKAVQRREKLAVTIITPNGRKHEFLVDPQDAVKDINERLTRLLPEEGSFDY